MVFAWAGLDPSMHSTTKEPAPVASASRRPTRPVADGDVRVVYNAVRTLVPEAGTLTLADLLGVTRLEPRDAAAAMDRLGRAGPISIHRLETAEAWLVRRTDR
jgi:hypothetical protein